MCDIKQDLMRQAWESGICKDGLSHMRTSDIDALVDYYIENPDWCLEQNFPSLSFLEKHFSNIEDKGVFIGKTFHGESLDDRQAYIFHNCNGAVKVGLNIEKGIIPMLYVSNGCDMEFIGVGDIAPQIPSEVPICIFGKNKVSARDNKYVKFRRYHKDTE